MRGGRTGRFALRGRTFLVTGAASGLGGALARTLARRGCHLALVDRDATGLAGTGRDAEAAGARVSLHVLDLADAPAILRLPEAVAARHGPLHGLVNNAGVALEGPFAALDLADVAWLLDVNLHAVLRMTHAFLPMLRAAEAAQIVNVASLYGIVAPAGQTAYAASKFAVRGFTEALRHECEGSDLGVSLVLPGGIATAIARNARGVPGLDPEAAARAVAAFERHLRLSPERAAEIVVRGIEARAPRIVVGADARRAILIQRLMPVRYWALIRRAFAE